MNDHFKLLKKKFNQSYTISSRLFFGRGDICQIDCFNLDFKVQMTAKGNLNNPKVPMCKNSNMSPTNGIYSRNESLV